jgi:hypothetical protein
MRVATPNLLYNVELTCCAIGDWNTQVKVEVIDRPLPIQIPNKWRTSYPVMCIPGEFVMGVTMVYEIGPYGMATGSMRCTGLRRSYVTLFVIGDGGDYGPYVEEAPADYALRGMALKGHIEFDSGAGGFGGSSSRFMITGARLYFASIVADRGPSKALTLYNAIWEGSQTVVSAFFVTILSGDTVSNLLDEDSRPLDSEKVLNGIYHPFGVLSLTNPSAATFAIADFRETNIRNSLESFCFLSADNLPDEADFIAGVVHPRGYPLNEIFGLENGYRVKKNSDNEFVVRFTNYINPGSQPFSKETPTFVAFPVWLDSNTVPGNIGEASVNVRNCTADSASMEVECRVLVGCGGGCNVRNRMGFSFLAIASEPAGVVHGHVAVDFDSGSVVTGQSKVYKCTVESQVVTNTTNIVDGEEGGYLEGGGYLITFDEPFEAPPSVIVSPHTDNYNISRPPIAMVEYVTEREAYVKVGKADCLVDDGGVVIECSFQPSSFDFVVVGPPKQRSLQPIVLPQCEN